MENITNEQTCVALGLFDGVHIGHRAVIGKAIELGKQNTLLPTAFTFTNGTLSVKKAKPIISDAQKEKMLLSLGIQRVHTESFESIRDMSPQEFFEGILLGKLCCRAIVCGYDFRFGKNAAGDVKLLKELCDKNGVKLSAIDKVEKGGETVSSTAIREYIASGNIEKANELLGYRLCYEGEIICGRKLGREMDFPTANQYIPQDVVAPRNGVYRSEMVISGISYDCITNAGIKPTVDYSGRPLFETHIFDFSADIYGKKVQLYLCELLREERRFSSVAELKEQIRQDVSLLRK